MKLSVVLLICVTTSSADWKSFNDADHCKSSGGYSKSLSTDEVANVRLRPPQSFLGLAKLTLPQSCYMTFTALSFSKNHVRVRFPDASKRTIGSCKVTLSFYDASSPTPSKKLKDVSCTSKLAYNETIVSKGNALTIRVERDLNVLDYEVEMMVDLSSGGLCTQLSAAALFFSALLRVLS